MGNAGDNAGDIDIGESGHVVDGVDVLRPPRREATEQWRPLIAVPDSVHSLM